MRPADWFLVQLPGDPVPGDAFGIRALSGKYAAISEVAGDAGVAVHHARDSGAASGWVGDAGDIFREKSQRMPGELLKAHDSYAVVAQALTMWAAAVDDAQAAADRGLQHARDAHADKIAAASALGAAQSSWTTVHAQQLTYETLVKSYGSVPPPGVVMPTDYQLRSTTRSALTARATMLTAQQQLADADARLAAARAMVLDARTVRDDAERAVIHQIHEAQTLAVKPSSVWEAIQDSAAWQTLVQVATVVLTVLSIVAIIIGGPLVWALLIAATILLSVDCLLSLAQGKNAWGELALLAIGLIPGGRIIGLAGRGIETLGRMGVAGEHLAAGVGAVTDALRNGRSTTVKIVELASGKVSELASAIPGGDIPGFYAGSAPQGILRQILNRTFNEIFEINAKNFRTEAGFSANCTKCVVATDHYLSGAEVVAAGPVYGPGAPVATVANHFGKTFDDFVAHDSYHAIAETLVDLGRGSRGIIYGSMGRAGGHVFNVIFDENGVVFLDGQTGWFASLYDFKSLSLLITHEGVR